MMDILKRTLSYSNLSMWKQCELLKDVVNKNKRNKSKQR